MALDNVSIGRLAEVCPALSQKIYSLARLVDPILFRITQGLRSWADQEALWAKGRDSNGVIIDPGAVVTKAPPGHSWHEFGLAIDFVPMINGQPEWDVKKPEWETIIQAALTLNLVSGKYWKTIVDIPHLQLTGRFPVSPTDEVREIFKTVGIKGVWVESELVNADGVVVDPLTQVPSAT